MIDWLVGIFLVLAILQIIIPFVRFLLVKYTDHLRYAKIARLAKK